MRPYLLLRFLPPLRRCFTMSCTIKPNQSLPTYFIAHGGASILFDDRPKNKTIKSNLKDIGQEILSLSPRPKAIVVFSAHFEAGENGVIEGIFIWWHQFSQTKSWTDIYKVNVKRGTPILVSEPTCRIPINRFVCPVKHTNCLLSMTMSTISTRHIRLSMSTTGRIKMHQRSQHSYANT